MSKKSRKKVARTNPAPQTANKKLVDDKLPVRSDLKAPPAAVKTYMSSEDLEKRYQYVKNDLKTIAIIAIPMILILVIASFFVNV